VTIVSIVKLFGDVLARTQQAFRSPYFGFVYGHAYMSPGELQQIGQLVGLKDNAVVAEFELHFAQLIGLGEAISYAAARMGFYELMRLQGISKGDEVILLGATCAVMSNAVIRTGATPVYADIDPETFGSSSNAIAACITPQTRMIVAQHSFGIPCDIEPIVKLAKEKNLFLLEDCALTLGSKVNGVNVGNFGDAALFSTDHSKPLNTLTGGVVYTQNKDLAKGLRLAQTDCPDLSATRQNALWRRLLLEAKYCVPARYGRMGLIDLLFSVKKRLIHVEGNFLTDDFGVTVTATYPYPAKLPAFLAAVGLIEINRWPKVSIDRKITLQRLIEAISKYPSGSYLPAAYKNPALEIIPLRFAWSEPQGGNTRNSIRKFIHVDWTWFISPIIATKEPLENLGYISGTCPVSEHIGQNMVNIPCIFEYKDTDRILNSLKIRIYEKVLSN
jgi:perosamine synthetase